MALINNILTLDGARFLSVPTGPPGVVLGPQRVAVPIAERNPEDGPISPRGVYDDDRTGLTFEFVTPWDTRVLARQGLLGYPYVSPLVGGGRWIQRLIPDYVPWLLTDECGMESPKPYLWCTSLGNEEGDGSVPDDQVTPGPWGENRYGYAFIQASYTTPTYEVLNDDAMVLGGFTDVNGHPDESWLKRYVTINSNPLSKSQQLPQGTFVFAANLAPPASNVFPGTPGRIELEADLEITWHRVPRAAVPMKFVNHYIANTVGGVEYVPAIEVCLGRVNLNPANARNPLFAGQKKGTLLLTAAVIKPIRSPIGSRLFDISYRFKYFGAKSAVSLTSADGSTGFQYGHQLVLHVGQPAPYTTPATPGTPIANPGYYEVISIGSAVSSNYLQANPSSVFVNLYNWADFTTLFQMPALARDPGNT